jgi:phage terminase small subunit
MNDDKIIHDDPETDAGAPVALKLRHERFVEGYLANGGNATEAARYAGYNQSPKSLKAHACRLLKKPEIVRRIRERMIEGARVHTDEILGVLANNIRGNIMDVIDEDGQVDLEAIRALDLGHLIRKVTIVKKQVALRGNPAGDDKAEAQTVKIELQSHPEAATHLAQLLRADDSDARDEFIDRLIFKIRDALVEFYDEMDKTGPRLSPAQVFERLAQAESPNYGFDLRLYREYIMKDLEIGSAQKAAPPAQNAAATAQSA